MASTTCPPSGSPACLRSSEIGPCAILLTMARVNASKLKELVITDSIQPTEAIRAARNIRVLPIDTLIGEAIGRTAAEESVSSLFD